MALNDEKQKTEFEENLYDLVFNCGLALEVLFANQNTDRPEGPMCLISVRDSKEEVSETKSNLTEDWEETVWNNLVQFSFFGPDSMTDAKKFLAISKSASTLTNFAITEFPSEVLSLPNIVSTHFEARHIVELTIQNCERVDLPFTGSVQEIVNIHVQFHELVITQDGKIVADSDGQPIISGK